MFLRHLLKFLLSLALISLALYLLDIQTIIKTIKNGSQQSFIIAVSLNLLAFLVMGLRWYILSVPVVRLPFWIQLGAYFRGAFLNTFTPANLGGDVYRITAFRKYTHSYKELVKLLLRERIIGLYGYVIVFIYAYIAVLVSINFHTPLAGNPYTYGVMAAFAICILPWLALRYGDVLNTVIAKIPAIKRKSEVVNLVSTLQSILTFKRIVPQMLLTILGIALWVISIDVIAVGYGLSVSLTHLTTVATLVELIRFVPVTMQGIGLREGAFAYLLAFLGHNPEQCFVLGTTAYLALSVAIILLGPLGYIGIIFNRSLK